MAVWTHRPLQVKPVGVLQSVVITNSASFVIISTVASLVERSVCGSTCISLHISYANPIENQSRNAKIPRGTAET